MKRALYDQLTTDLTQKMVFLTGPRQSGKTTLSQLLLAAKPGTGMDEVTDQQTDHQRKGRDYLKIYQRLDADAANFLGVLDMRNARYHRAGTQPPPR